MEKFTEEQPSVMEPGDSTNQHLIHNLFNNRVLEQPLAQAINAWDGSFTYAEIAGHSSNLAALLRSKGVKPECFVPICMRKSKWVPIAMLAVLKAGGAFVMMDHEHPIQRLKDMCQTVEAALIITSENISKVQILELDIIHADREVRTSSETCENVEAEPSNAAYAMFTSGSTGRPKGAVIEHQSFCSSTLAHCKAIGLNNRSRVLQFSSFAFDVSLSEIVATLIMGGCICMPSDTDRKHNLATATTELDATFAIFTPSLARVLDNTKFPSLKTVALIGEAIQPEDVKKWAPQVDFFGTYGPTEAAVICAVRHFKSEDYRISKNIGFGTGVELWVVDSADHNKLVATGSVGELILAGKSVGRGYVNNQLATEKAFIAPPIWHESHQREGSRHLYKTGDLVLLEEDKSLTYIGRKDSQVKLNGQRLELGEIESHIQSASNNIQNVVVELVSINKRNNLVAFFVLGTMPAGKHYKRGTPEPWLLPLCDIVEAVIHTLETRLSAIIPQYMKPKFYIPLHAMPLSASGKSDRQSLRSFVMNMPWQDIEAYCIDNLSQLPQEDIESQDLPEFKLKRLWAQVLGINVETISPEDQFPNLGGGALRAIKLAGAARRAGLDLSVSNIYKYPMLSQMAAVATPVNMDEYGQKIKPFSLLKTPNDSSMMMKLAVEQCHDISDDDIEDIYPCSPLQAGMIALTAKSRKSGAYCLAYEYTLADNIDISQFKTAWEVVVQSNPLLRTRVIQALDGDLYQVVLYEYGIWQPSNDPFHAEDAGPWKFGQKLARFQVTAGYPNLFRLSLHHAVTDIWAVQILLKQAMLAYNGSPLRIQPFSNFIAAIPPSHSAQNQAFWKQQFAGLTTDIFPKLSSSKLIANPSESRSITIPNVESKGGQYSLFNRLKLAWAVVNCESTLNPDVVFGCVVTGRAAPVTDIEDLSGPTIATVPIRIKIDPQSTISEMLQAIHDDYGAMIPFEQTGIQHIQRISPEASIACHFQSLLVVQARETPLPDIFSIVKSLMKRQSFANYPITLECQPQHEGLAIEIFFDRDLVDVTRAESLLQRLRQIFELIVPSRGHFHMRSLLVNDTSKAPDQEVTPTPGPVQSEQEDIVVSKLPTTDTEKTLHAVLSDIIRKPAPELSIEDNFFTLGLDSISAMNFVTCAKEQGLELTVADIFENPTIACLSPKACTYKNLRISKIPPFSLIRNDQVEEILGCAASHCLVDKSDIEDIYPCSGLQEGLLVSTIKDQSTYIARYEYLVPRNIDLKRFRKAWGVVVLSNAILRTRIFQSAKYGTLQAVLKTPLEWSVYSSLEEQRSSSPRFLVSDGARLTRMELVISQNVKFPSYFIWTVHHSLFDGWSQSLVWAQVQSAYQGRRLQTQLYNGFIKYITSVESPGEFWRAEFENLDADIFPPMEKQNYMINSASFFDISICNTTSLKKHYTISSVLQLAWAIVVAHYTDSNDVVFGVTMNGRTSAMEGIAELTGPTIATVPLRVQLKRKDLLEHALSRLQQQNARLIPFLHFGLQNIRKLSLDAARACEFQSHLSIQPAGMLDDKTSGWLVPVKQPDSQEYEGFLSYALTLVCHLSADNSEIRVTACYDSTIMENIEARRLISQFGGVVHQILNNPDITIDDIEVISSEDLQKLVEWNQDIPVATNETLHDLVLVHSLESPYTEAVCAWDGDLTYKELGEISGKLAQYILSLPELPKQRVNSTDSSFTLEDESFQAAKSNHRHASDRTIALCLERSRWSIITILAVLRSGYACVLLEPGCDRLKLKKMIQLTNPLVILTSETHKDLVRGFGCKVYRVGESLLHRLERFGNTSLPNVLPTQAAFIVLTSGSTGSSKAIVLEHINLSTSICAHSDKLNLSPTSRSLHAASYASDASIYEIFETLLCGGCICIPSDVSSLASNYQIIC